MITFDIDRALWLINNRADEYAINAQIAKTHNEIETANEALTKEIALRDILLKIYQDKMYLDHMVDLEIGL